MTIRALVLGLTLGLGLSVLSYPNNSVVRQTLLIGNFLPIGVFGVVVLLLLVANPALRLLGDQWVLRRGEVALATAIGLAACGWPGSNFYRTFTQLMALPAHQIQTQPSWQATRVMSYVPGGSAELGLGHVRDWRALGARVIEEGQANAATPAKRIWSMLSLVERRQLREAVQPGGGLDDWSVMIDAINRMLARPDFLTPEAIADAHLPAEGRADLTTLAEQPRPRVVAMNRALLVAAFPELIRPAPAGAGALLAGGAYRPELVDPLLKGTLGDWPDLGEVPWRAWWPTIRLWGGAALAVGLASLCLALIVHPQWSQRELLAYPIPRFVDLLCTRQPGGWLPEVARQRSFWLAALFVLALHAVNALHAWFPAAPDIPMVMPLGPLRELFPTAARVPIANEVFMPRIYLSVIAFTFFLTTTVSFSLGIANYAFLILGVILLSNGAAVETEYLGAGNTNLVRFGSYLGMGLMIFYTGRHYYINVLLSALGLPRAPSTPAYAVWGARGLAVAMIGSVVLLGTGGLDWAFAALLVGMVMLALLVLSRIVAETGAFYLQPWWIPVGMLTGLMGIEAIGPTMYVMLALGSLVLVGDPREAVMPYLVNALRIADRTGDITPRRVSPWLGTMLVVGFLVAGVVTLATQYSLGIDRIDTWSAEQVPAMPFSQLARHIADLTATGALGEATAHSGFIERIAAIRPEPGAWAWMLLGVALVVACAGARLRLPWWPLHPVLFLVWGTTPMARFGFSFLLGWAIKEAVVRVGGARGYAAVVPPVCGVIVGELLAAIILLGIGAAYYLATGMAPAHYWIFPA